MHVSTLIALPPLLAFQVLSKTREQLQALPGALERVRDELLMLDGQHEGAGHASASMLQVSPLIPIDPLHIVCLTDRQLK